MSQELIINQSQELSGDPLLKGVLSKLNLVWVNEDKIANKLSELLDAQTLNAKWDVMPDNKAQLEALKLVLNMNGIKTQKSLNINIFNMPSKDQDLRY